MEGPVPSRRPATKPLPTLPPEITHNIIDHYLQSEFKRIICRPRPHHLDSLQQYPNAVLCLSQLSNACAVRTAQITQQHCQTVKANLELWNAEAREAREFWENFDPLEWTADMMPEHGIAWQNMAVVRGAHDAVVNVTLRNEVRALRAELIEGKQQSDELALQVEDLKQENERLRRQLP